MSHYEELSLVDFIVHDNEQYFVGLKYDYAVNEAAVIVFMSSDNGYEKVARLQGVTAVYAPYIAKALSKVLQVKKYPSFYLRQLRIFMLDIRC
jgi:hypothetical protein